MKNQKFNLEDLREAFTAGSSWYRWKKQPSQYYQPENEVTFIERKEKEVKIFDEDDESDNSNLEELREATLLAMMVVNSKNSREELQEFHEEWFRKMFNELNPPNIEEEKIPFMSWQLQELLGWEKFCDLTGIDYYAKKEGFELKSDEIFYIPKSKAIEFDLMKVPTL